MLVLLLGDWGYGGDRALGGWRDRGIRGIKGMWRVGGGMMVFVQRNGGFYVCISGVLKGALNGGLVFDLEILV